MGAMSDQQPTPGPSDPPGGEPAGERPATGLSPTQTALATAVQEIERHVSTGGWDGPVRVFAVVATGEALAKEPNLARQLPPAVVAAAQRDPAHLTSVEQEDLPPAESLEDLLAVLSWPETVDGAAVVVERVVLPPEAEEGMPEDTDAALEYLMAHPDRQDVRLAVGVLRSGEAWCAVRTRAADDDAAVAGGPDVVPGLVEAVRATLL
jgi:hypothetical protein